MSAHRFVAVITASFLLANVGGAQRVSDVDQRAIELRAATYTDSANAWWGDFERFAFDAYAYSIPSLQPGVTTGKEALLESMTSHDSGHLQALSARLGVSATLEARNSCWPIRPDGCRMGAHRGVAAFSPTVEKDGKATIVLYRVERASPGSRTPTLLSAATFTMVRRGGVWHVEAVRVGAS